MFLPTVILLVVVYALYRIYSNLQLRARRRLYEHQHGCQTAAHYLPGDRWVLTFIFRSINAARHHKLLQYLHEDYDRYGPTHLAASGTIFTIDAENVKTVVATRFEDWDVKQLRQRGVGPLLGDGIFTTDGLFWAHSRSMIRPAFEKSQFSDLGNFEEHVNALLDQIPKDGSTVDLQDLFHRLSMDASMEFLTGISTASLSGGEGAARAASFVESYELALEDATLRARLGKLYYILPFRSKQHEAVRLTRQYVEPFVEAALQAKEAKSADETGKKTPESKFVFLNELAKNDVVDVNRIRNEAMNILVAGRDTTASLLSALWFSLARDLGVWKKLQEEVDALDGEMPTYGKLRDMKYLRYCAQEALRLYPPVPMLPKSANRDTILPHGGGPDGLSPLFVPKGDRIIYNIYSMQRQTSVYGPDAQVFRPERWEDPSLRPGWNFLPFGGGPRVCLGQQYALTETYYVTVRMMQTFRRIESRDPEPWREKLSFTLSSLDGTKVGLFPSWWL